MRKRIAITGMGAVTPLGLGADALFDGSLAGVCAVGADGFGRADGFEASDHLTKKDARRSDRYTQFALVATLEAMTQAGWTEGLPTDSDRIGSLLGTGFGGVDTLGTQTVTLVRSGGVKPLAMALAMPNAASGMVALKHGLHGPAHGVVSAGVAGSEAIGRAARLIAAGDADAMVAGGSEAPLEGLTMALAERAGVLSRSGVPRPFDVRRDGLVLGEAAGIVILEDHELAAGRGATIYGEVLGYGAAVDVTPDEGSGAALAIEAALRDACVEPERVRYVNADGPSTRVGDRLETSAVKRALGDHAMRIPVSSTKGAIGHTLGGAGAIEAVVTAMALRRRMAPPTVGHERPDDGLDLNYVPGSAQPLPELGPGGGDDRAIALSNSLGLGGHHAVLCLAA
ncbi:MAG: beta-ketoacyl-[acyl-carrier-protein] synthase family protein [Actinomycetota bacterium]|nr:beta-ketoacyl-[acyl-carrier-protein] synthase family protein [Actinomycetota bacterium]